MAPHAITPANASSPLPAYTPPIARITSPGTRIPVKAADSKNIATDTITYPNDTKRGRANRSAG